ncbi:hypothetical protein [Pseudomonas putida]|uniref:hypothetical protein n=1 Tax=Pseudomonas putida TaxID=303 RepID=UPI000BF03486|nr:hypothetical protein [Pseudomonas putida]MDD2018958.1 hypothetical protein [Pseudomonas putida]PEI10755.1 hypothetical protein CRM86_23735 [Pseudomonas putida]
MEQQVVEATNAPAYYPVLALVSEGWADIAHGAVFDLSAVELSIGFPCGLAIIDRDGALLPETVKVDIQVMQVSEDGVESGEWVDSFSGDWTMGSLDHYADAIQLIGDGFVRVRARKSSPSSEYARVDTVLKITLKPEENDGLDDWQRESKQGRVNWERMRRSLDEKERQARILHHRLARIEETLGLAPFA